MRIGDLIYLDHQATTPVDPRVVEAMVPYFSDKFGNPHSSEHILGWTAAKAVDQAAEAVGELMGADADEIIFTSGATEANNLALLGVGRRAVGGQRRRILCGSIEHKSVLATARALRDFYGYEVELIPVDENGRVSLSALRERLSEEVLLVSIAAVNNEIGTIQEIAKIAPLVASVGAILHCDAAQAPCATDMRDLGAPIDMLSLSAHKMYGPKGVGALYVRRELQDRIEPIIYGGGQQKNLRSGTTPSALCVGMGAAATLLLGDNGRSERESVQAIRDHFVEKLGTIGVHIKMNGPVEGRHPGNANVCFEGFSAEDILAAVQPRVAASSGAACSSGIPEASHVLRAIGLSDEDAAASIRFSIGRHTTIAEADEAVELLREAIARLAEADLR